MNEAPVDDFWMRDIMPTFALCGEGPAQEVIAIDWNFNGWGGTRDRPLRAGDRLPRLAATMFGVQEGSFARVEVQKGFQKTFPLCLGVPVTG